MVGSAFSGLGSTKYELILVGRQQADLLQKSEFLKILDIYKPDAVIHLAARVGGVKGNTDFISDFYSQNARMNCNVLDACNERNVQKVISLLSTCVYPDDVKYPLTEDQIHNGPPHPSNFGYAYAKRMLDVHSRALRQQYGRNYICAVPNNLYGPHDNFDLENGHVIPAIIRKIWEAKMYDQTPVLWGDGSPLREFTFSIDIAKILLFLLENYSGMEPCNIGSTGESSIREIAKIICNNLDYDYNKIVWDDSKPSGQYRKPSSNDKLMRLGWPQENYTSLEEGLQTVCEWFQKNYPEVRGIK